MSGKYTYYDFVDVYDDKIFTRQRAEEWRKYIVDSYRSVYDYVMEILDSSSLIRLTVDKALLEETIIDAIIGMRKIVDSRNNSVEDPNSFKIASYLSYWWLRHKPVSVHYPPFYDIRNIELVRLENETDQEYEERRLKVIWQLKHLNELVAVQMVIHYIFDVENPVCKKHDCKRVINKNTGNFCFESFDEMYAEILKKLTYHFSYRTIAPKVIEHILEAYTFHPAFALTGPHWSGDLEESSEEE